MNARITAEEHIVATSIRLSPEIERRLAFPASQTGRTKAFYLREIIDRGLDESKTTTWPQPSSNASAKDKSECMRPRTRGKSLAWAVDYTHTAVTQR